MAGRTPPSAALRGAVRAVFARIARIYFREIEVAGEIPLPDTRSRLFGANHVNALVDPILVLTQAPCAISPIAKSTLWNIPGLRWILDAADAVPIVRRRDDPTKSGSDNDAVFARVATHLAGGGNILIFPEGTSHNEPHLLALKSGAGRMLARARASAEADEGAGGGDAPPELTFQAVALEFDERDVFRSRCLVLFGPVRRVEAMASGTATDDEIAARVTAQLRADLTELLIEADTWDARVLVVRVASLFASASASTLVERNALGRQVERARDLLREAAPEVVARLEADLRAYFTELEELGLVDADVTREGGPGGARDARSGALGAALAIVALPLAAVGFALYALPYQLPRLVTKRLRAEGDIASTYKLGVGLVVFPAWALALVVLGAVLLASPWNLVFAALAVASPFAALPWIDRLDGLTARARILAPRELADARVSALVARREALMSALASAHARAGGAEMARAAG